MAVTNPQLERPNLKRPKGWPEDKPMAVCVNIPLEWWEDGHSPGTAPQANPLRNDVTDTAAIQWAEYAMTTGIYRMCDIAEEFDVKIGCHASAIVTESHPHALKRVFDGGHEIQAHCWAQHQLLCYMDREEEDAHIKKCNVAYEALLGERPTGFALPRGMLSPNTEELLAINGFKVYADDMSGDLPKLKETQYGPVVCVPYDMEVNDLPFYMRYGNPLKELTAVVKDLIEGYPKIGMPPTVADMTFHAQVSGRIIGAIQFREILEMLAATPWIWLTTRTELADLVLAEYEENKA